MHQFVGTWGTAFLAAFAVISVAEALQIFHLASSTRWAYWILTETPYYPVQILVAFHVGWDTMGQLRVGSTVPIAHLRLHDRDHPFAPPELCSASPAQWTVTNFSLVRLGMSASRSLHRSGGVDDAALCFHFLCDSCSNRFAQGDALLIGCLVRIQRSASSSATHGVS